MRITDRDVGVINSSGVFVSFRREKDHVLRVYNSLGISYDVLMDLRRRGVHKIILILEMSVGTQIKYESTVEEFLEHGRVWHDGHDHQRHISLSDLAKKDSAGVTCENCGEQVMLIMTENVRWLKCPECLQPDGRVE